MTNASLKSLESVLRNFKLQELCDVALLEFPEISWKEVQDTIVGHREVLSIKNVIKVLVNTVKDLSKEEIDERTSNLLLLAVGKSQRKTWNSFSLTNKIPVRDKDTLENIKSIIRRTGMLANINMISIDNRYVLSFEKKIILRNRTLRKQHPIYFQFFKNEPYLFCSRKVIENKMIDSIIEALGYQKWKLCNLTGPNVNDLLTLLRNKKNGHHLPSLLFSDPQPTPNIKKTDSGVNFGQKQEVKEYAKQIFGEKPPQLQSLSVSLKDSTWIPTRGFNKMDGESMDGVNLTFKTSNVAELFKEMIAAGAVSRPIPEYMKAVLYKGKNKLKITHSR